MINLTDEQKKLLNIVDNRTDFYFKVENATIDNYEIFDTIYEAHLYITLCRFCNNQQVAFPSYKTLADYCFCSKRTIINAMNSLVAKGLINKVSRKKEDQIVNDTNLYTVNNIKKYLEVENEKVKKINGLEKVVQEVHYPSAGGALPLVQEVHYPSAGGAPNKEQVIKNNYKKNHDHDNELDFFENLFKEFGINFTTTNKESVLRLRKSLSLKDVELYLRETYQAIKDNKDVVNVAALFSSKIAKGERQINSKPKEKNKENIKTIELEEIKLEEVKEFKKETIKDTNNKIEKTDKIEKINEMDQQEQAINESLEKYSNLTTEEQNKIEEQAIELLCKCENLEKGFILGAKKTSPNIYTGMVRKYIHECINQL